MLHVIEGNTITKCEYSEDKKEWEYTYRHPDIVGDKKCRVAYENPVIAFEMLRIELVKRTRALHNQTADL